MNNDLKTVIESILEARYLKRVKRSGTALLLGPEVDESVAEHSFYVSLWALVIHNLDQKLDLAKLLTMCLIHDLEEVRTGDLNLVNRLYLKKESIDNRAFQDMWKNSSLGKELIIIHHERTLEKSDEALAAYDCDVLAELMTEKEYLEKGNEEAQEWIEFTISRLKTKSGKEIAKQLIDAHFAEWWEQLKNRIRKKSGIPEKIYK